MKNNYYIKYFIKSIENPLFKDITAWHIWQFCLLMAYPKGTFTMGRFQMADFTGVKGMTAYKALQRLKKAKMITIQVTGGINNRFSEISIVNWEKYQSLGTTPNNNPNNNQVTIKEQSSNNQVTHYNRELRIKNIYIPPTEFEKLKKKFPDVNLLEELEKANDWLKMTGKRYKDYVAFFRNWLRKCNTKDYNKRAPTKQSPEEIRLIKFLEENQIAKNPSAYVNKIKKDYGDKYFSKLLDIEFSRWFEYLNYWTKSKA